MNEEEVEQAFIATRDVVQKISSEQQAHAKILTNMYKWQEAKAETINQQDKELKACEELIKRYANVLDILKSSVVELKQRLDRVENHTKMPGAGPQLGTNCSIHPGHDPKVVEQTIKVGGLGVFRPEMDSSIKDQTLPGGKYGRSLNYTDLSNGSTLQQDTQVMCACCPGSLTLKKGHEVDHRGGPYCDECAKKSIEPEPKSEYPFCWCSNCQKIVDSLICSTCKKPATQAMPLESPGLPYQGQDFRWGEIGAGATRRAAHRESGYNYAMQQIKAAIKTVYVLMVHRYEFSGGLGCWGVFTKEEYAEAVALKNKFKKGDYHIYQRDIDICNWNGPEMRDFSKGIPKNADKAGFEC